MFIDGHQLLTDNARLVLVSREVFPQRHLLDEGSGEQQRYRYAEPAGSSERAEDERRPDQRQEGEA
jgi:hypothetical protein